MLLNCLLVLTFYVNITSLKSCDGGKCKKIMDGQFTYIEEFPHSVAFFKMHDDFNRIQYFCGGSVLNQRIVLSAAHCFYLRNVSGEKSAEEILDSGEPHDQNLEHFRALTDERTFMGAGHENLGKMTIVRGIENIILHECYSRLRKLHDIALVLLKGELPLGVIKRVVITSDFPADVEKANVSGWGLRGMGKGPSRILKYAQMKVYSQRKCCKIFRNVESSTPWNPGQMCAGNRHGNESANQPLSGDSGGALVVSRFHQIGIVSFSFSKKPSVDIFTNVTYYHGWIVTHAKKLLSGYK